MTPELMGLAGVIALLLLLAAGTPIAAALGLVGIGGLAWVISPEAAMIKSGVIAFDVASRYELGVLPLFLLMAQLAFGVGAGRDFYNAAASFIGHRRGGLALASIGACGAFGAVSGSSLATVATMGLVALPEMRKYGYAPSLATGALAAGGTIGSLTPPSAALIVFGILAEQSIGKLFTAAIVPAVTQGILYMVTILLLCWWRPALAPATPKANWKDRWRTLIRLADFGLLIALVLGGIVLGWFSPTEAASIGAAGMLVIALLRRKADRATLTRAVGETLRMTGMIYAIIITAMIFSTFIAATGFGDTLSGWVVAAHAGKTGTVALMVVVILLLGMFLDGLAMMTLTIPIFLPMVHQLGVNPILFGVVMVRAMEIGFIHPPVGMNIYIIHKLAEDVPITKVFKGIVPFLLADFVHLAFLIGVPSLILFLPDILS